jgi:hypothetical protein
MRSLILAGTVLFAALAGAAQSAAPPQAKVVDELVVTARAPGPPWWRVSKGDSTVWILGVPQGLPHGFAWNGGSLEARLLQVRQVILPPEITFSLLDVASDLAILRRTRSPGGLSKTLPPEVYDRLVASARALGKRPAQYERWNGFWASVSLLNDYRRHARIELGEPVRRIEQSARAHGLRPKRAAAYRLAALVGSLADEITPAIEQACISQAASTLLAGPQTDRRMAQAWNRGDLHGVVAEWVMIDRCEGPLPAMARFGQQEVADEAAAVESAAKSPGAAIVVVELPLLLSPGGLLQTLKARGYEIHAPDE